MSKHARVIGARELAEHFAINNNPNHIFAMARSLFVRKSIALEGDP
jgi:hypothetical protein